MSLNFKYKRVSEDISRPIIPLNVRMEDGSLVKVAGLLDSGSDVILIPKDIAEMLGIPLGKSVDEIDGVGGRVNIVKSSIMVSLDDGHKVYRIPHPLGVSVQISGSVFDDILIGRIPFFEEFTIEFDENAKRVKLTPSHRH
jgi:predicted aspartyl protease